MGKSKRRSPHNKRRRNRNVRKEEVVAEEVHVDEIQAQLERQRRKRALESAEQVTSKPPAEAQPIIGGFEYDPIKKTYFPKGADRRVSGKQNTPLRATPRTQFCYTPNNIGHIVVREVPTAWLGHASQIATNPQRFFDLRARWAGRIVLNTMQTESSAKRDYDPASRQPAGWTSLLPQLKRSHNPSRQNAATLKDVPWDLGCKNDLHASSRTFDVQVGPDESAFPHFATLVDGGSFIRVAREPRVWNERQYMGPEWERSTHFEADRGNHMIRFNPQREPFPHVALLNSSRSGSLDILHLGLLQSHSMRVDISSGDSHDVAFHPLFGSGTSAELAVAPRIAQNTRTVTLFRDLRSTTSFEMRTRDFSKSDALCVEYLAENTILYGHRNGSISLLDTRTRTIQSVACADEQTGSTTSVLPLTNGNMFLAKKAFGSCGLFDIRKMSPDRKDSSMVWNMRVPKNTVNAMLSTCCSGIATDPTQTIAIAPFADGQRRSHFALWSLTNGELVGTKLCNSTANRNTGIGLPHCELRSTITPTWQLKSDHDGASTVRRRPNAWGLWFKSGQVETEAPCCVGSIHQLMFRGRPDELGSGCQIDNL